ncbi:MAG TPA: hypothetical protein VFR88_02650, partial [Microlunatus sp.]|nr:hypothetical protein [Microlunatus sp.]
MSTAVCLQAVLREGAGPALRADLAAADVAVSAGESPLAAVPGVHFARWLVVPGDASLPGGAVPDTLVYTADADGSPAGHLRELERHAGELLDQLFGHCLDYPAAPGDRARWLRAHRVANAASYVNTVGLTVDRIGTEARLSDWLQRRLDQQRAELRSLRPAEIHRRLRSALAADPAMAYALDPAAGERLSARLRRWLTLTSAVIIVVVLLPLLVVVGVPWLLALRRLERRDHSSTERPDSRRVDRLRSREDAFAHNPFAALGVVKPGSLRANTVKIVLLGISVAA